MVNGPVVWTSSKWLGVSLEDCSEFATTCHFIRCVQLWHYKYLQVSLAKLT